MQFQVKKFFFLCSSALLYSSQKDCLRKDCFSSSEKLQNLSFKLVLNFNRIQNYLVIKGTISHLVKLNVLILPVWSNLYKTKNQELDILELVLIELYVVHYRLLDNSINETFWFGFPCSNSVTLNECRYESLEHSE